MAGMMCSERAKIESTAAVMASVDGATSGLITGPTTGPTAVTSADAGMATANQVAVALGWTRRAGVCLLLLLWSVGAAAQTAHAQEAYRLDDATGQVEVAATSTVAADPDSPEGLLQAVRKLMAENSPRTALKRIKAWMERYPNHPLMPEALLLKGMSQEMRHDFYKALFDYEQLIREYPGSEQFIAAVEREAEIAKLFSAGMKRRWAGMRIIGAEGEAEEIFIRIQERLPGSELGEAASYELGEHYFRRGQMPNAVIAFDAFLTNYARSARREHVMLRLIESNLARFTGPAFDPSGLIEAAEWIRQYRRDYPVSAREIGSDALLIRIDESLAEKLYNTAAWYQWRGEKVSAATTFRRVVADHPDSVAAIAAKRRLEQMDQPLVDVDYPTNGGALPAGPESADALSGVSRSSDGMNGTDARGSADSAGDELP